MSMRKGMKQLVDELEDQGWTVALTGGCHYKATSAGMLAVPGS